MISLWETLGSTLAAIVQALAALITLWVIIQNSISSNKIMEAQFRVSAERAQEDNEYRRKMTRKVAAILTRRFTTMAEELQSPVEPPYSSLLEPALLHKGLPAEIIISHLDVDLAYKIFDIYNSLEGFQHNLKTLSENNVEDPLLQATVQQRTAEFYKRIIELIDELTATAVSK